MKTIKGPGIFLAQFAGDTAPFNTLEGMAGWAAKHGFVGIQIPSWDRRLFDLQKAAESQAYCDESKRDRGSRRAGHYRAFNAFAGPAGCQSYGLRHAARRICAARHCRRPESAASLGRTATEWAARAATISASRRTPRFPEHWRGRFFIRGRSGLRGLSTRHLRSWGARWLPILDEV